MISSPPPAPVIAPVSVPGAISSYSGIQVWSDDHKLFVRRDGQITAIPNAQDGDVGPGPDGRPRLAFIRNHRVTVSQPDGSDAKQIPGTASAEMPTIYGDRIAYEYADRPVVISLSDTRHRHNLRNMGTTITDLELHGTTLAVTDTFVGDDFSYDTVYVESVTHKDAWPEMVGTVTGGEAGRSLVGPSWARRQALLLRGLPDRRAVLHAAPSATTPRPRRPRPPPATRHCSASRSTRTARTPTRSPATTSRDMNSEPSNVLYSKALTFKPRRRLGSL